MSWWEVNRLLLLLSFKYALVPKAWIWVQQMKLAINLKETHTIGLWLCQSLPHLSREPSDFRNLVSRWLLMRRGRLCWFLGSAGWDCKWWVCITDRTRERVFSLNDGYSEAQHQSRSKRVPLYCLEGCKWKLLIGFHCNSAVHWTHCVTYSCSDSRTGERCESEDMVKVQEDWIDLYPLSP